MMKNKFYAILAMILHTTFLNKKCFLQSKFLWSTKNDSYIHFDFNFSKPLNSTFLSILTPFELHIILHSDSTLCFPIL